MSKITEIWLYADETYETREEALAMAALCGDEYPHIGVGFRWTGLTAEEADHLLKAGQGSLG